MPKNKVQFQRGMGLCEFMDKYGTAEQCEQALFAWRLPRGFVCPECGQTAYCALKSRRLIQCNGCRRQTSVTAGAIFAGSKLPLSVWFLAMHPITQAKNGISSLELSRQLAISQNSAWLIDFTIKFRSCVRVCFRRRHLPFGKSQSPQHGDAEADIRLRGCAGYSPPTSRRAAVPAGAVTALPPAVR